MKKIVLLAVSLFVAASAFAQEYHTHYQSVTEPQTLLPIGTMPRETRTEIILPEEVNGYNLYAADLHIHTTYSDGTLNVKGRTHEAWRDGLDIIVSSDHMSIRPVKGVEGQTTPDEAKEKRGARPAKSVADVVKMGESLGLLVIPGVELTGDGWTQGHFNALFTTDNKAIYDYDGIQAIRNARAQGAIIMHNHPGWRHKTLDRTPFEEQAYAEKLVDGIEIMNGTYFYPRAIEEAKSRKWFMAATTDIGDELCIHPAQKFEVGQRLAALALKQTYGQLGYEPKAPQMAAYSIKDGKAVITMSNCEGGLIPKHEEIIGFEIAGADKVFHKAQATLSATAEVTVWSDEVKQPMAVRYSFRNFAPGNLKNVYGIPAVPFRTDMWNDAK